MHPGFFGFWKQQRHGHCGPRAAEVRCGVGEGIAAEVASAWQASGGDEGGGGFGVRRPLRFLAYKLELDEKQVAELASILDDLKIERAQASVDHRRSSAALADALAGDALDAARLASAADERVASAGRVRDAVVKALTRIHALLNAEQRKQLAYLIRTGTLSV